MKPVNETKSAILYWNQTYRSISIGTWYLHKWKYLYQFVKNVMAANLNQTISMVWIDEKSKLYFLTCWLPRLDIVCFYNPGDAGPLVDLCRDAYHLIELANSHGVTQIICVNDRNKPIITRLTGWGLSLLPDDYWRKIDAITNRCQKKHREEQRFLCDRVAQPVNECSLHLLAYMFSNGSSVDWIPPQVWVNRIC